MIQPPQLPTPGLYADWRLWAEALIAVLAGWFGRMRQVQSIPLVRVTVATLPATAQPGTMVVVFDEVGGEVPAWKDASGNWRRVTDRAVVS